MKNLKDWQGCEPPHKKPMEGRYVRLEPIDIAKHGDELFEAATQGDADTRFRWLFEDAPSSREEFQIWLDMAEASTDPMYFAVIDKKSGKVAGRQGMMRMDPANGVAEIGNIHWGPLIQKTPATTEAFYLFGSHLFDELGYRRFEWKCNNRNIPSKDAALRYGMTPEGVFRQALVVKGENRDTAWFSILDHEWSKVGQAMQLWLDPENFDSGGQQIRRLEDIRRGLVS